MIKFINVTKFYGTVKALDKINERFGDFTLFYGPTIEASNLADDTVGFGRTRERKGWKEE